MVTTTTITINNGGFPQVNYAFAMTIPFITGQMNADYSDIRFKVTGSSTVLACWRRSYTPSTTAVFEVNIPALPTGTTSLDLSYGDATLLTTSSFALTFPYFNEDFEAGNAAFLSAWTNTGSNASYTTTYLDASGATVTGGTDYNQRTRWAAATYSGVAGAATTTTPISNTYNMVLQGNYGGLTLDPPGAENAWTSKSFREFTLPAGDYRLEFSAQGLMGRDGYDMLRVTLTNVTDATVIREWKRGGVANSTTLASGLSATYSAVGTYTGDFTLTAQKTLRFEGAAHNGGWAGTLILDQIFVRTYPVTQPTATGASITPVTGNPTSKYVRGITVVNPGSALSNYAFSVTVPFVSGQMNADFSDIRFTLTGSTAPLPCWRWSYTASSTAVFWVDIPSLPGGTTYLDLASGDTQAVTTSSMSATFPYFTEDFETGVLSLSGPTMSALTLSTWTFSGSSTSPDPVSYPNLNGTVPYGVISTQGWYGGGVALRGGYNLWLKGNIGASGGAEDAWTGKARRQFVLPAGSYRLEFTAQGLVYDTVNGADSIRVTVTNITSAQTISEWKYGLGVSTLAVGAGGAATGGYPTWGAITSYAGDFTLAASATVQFEGAANRGYQRAELLLDEIFVRAYPASPTSPPTVTIESVAHALTRGTSSLVSRADHTHVIDGRQAGLTGMVTDITPTGTAAITASAGTSTLLARSDHVHKTPATWPLDILVNGIAPSSQPTSTARPSLRITPQLTQVWYRDYAVADRTVIGFTQPAAAAQGPMAMPRYVTTTLAASAAAISLTGVDGYGASQRLGYQTMTTGYTAVPATPVGSQLLVSGALQEQYVTNSTTGTYTTGTVGTTSTPVIDYVLPGNWPGYQYTTLVLRALLATTSASTTGKIWLTLNNDRGTDTYRAAGIRENSGGRGYWQKTGSASDFNVTGSGVQLGETGDQYDPAYVEVVLTSRPYQSAPVAATAALGGSISGTTFTDTTHGTGTFAVGQVLTGTNVVKGTWIVERLTGTGGNNTGTYRVSTSQTVTSQTISGSAVTSWSNQAIGIQSTVVRGGTATASVSRYASAGSWNSGGDMLTSVGLETDALFASGSTVSLFGYVGRDEVPPTLTLVTYSLPVPVQSGASLTITATFSESMVASPTIAISGANLLAATAMTFGTANTDGTESWSYAGTVGGAGGTNTLTFAGNDAHSNALVGTVTAQFVSVGPVTTITLNTATINEGGTVIYTVTIVSGVAAGTTVYWVMRTTTGTALAADFTDATLSGSYTVSNGLVDTVTRTWANDLTTEGNETWVMEVRTGSITGPVIATSSPAVVADTSLTPVATVTGTPSSLNEGSAATYTITIVSGVAAGATVYWVMRTTTGTALAADFTDNTLSGSYTVSNGLVDTVTRTWANDVTTEGTETWVMDVRIGNITGTLIGTSSPATTVADTSVAGGYVLQLGTKAPVYGANGGPHPPTASWTAVINFSFDNNYFGVTIPTFTIASTAYTTAYIGTNTYITFGAGSINSTSLGASNPPYPKVMLGAADNSDQRVSRLISGTDFTRIRYEGTAATSGTAGSPNIVYEATFFNPARTGGVPWLEVLFGSHARLTGSAMIASASTSYATYTLAANQSYVFVGNATGTAWTVYTGYYVSGTGY